MISVNTPSSKGAVYDGSDGKFEHVAIVGPRKTFQDKKRFFFFCDSFVYSPVTFQARLEFCHRRPRGTRLSGWRSQKRSEIPFDTESVGRSVITIQNYLRLKINKSLFLFQKEIPGLVSNQRASPRKNKTKQKKKKTQKKETISKQASYKTKLFVFNKK